MKLLLAAMLVSPHPSTMPNVWYGEYQRLPNIPSGVSLNIMFDKYDVLQNGVRCDDWGGYLWSLKFKGRKHLVCMHVDY